MSDRRAEFLSIDATVENFQIERVVWENGQPSYKVANPVVCRFQRGQTQVLLMCGLEDVIGDIAGLCHLEIAVIHGLSNNHRHQAIFIGDFLCIAWL